MRRSALAAPLAVTALLSACHTAAPARQETEARLEDGTYAVVNGAGWAAADEARVRAIRARIDRAQSRVVFTLADGSEQTVTLAPRPRARWKGDCATMTSLVFDEVADLSPAPLRLGSLAFTAPVLYPKCGPTRIIVANDGSDAEPWLALDRQ